MKIALYLCLTSFLLVSIISQAVAQQITLSGSKTAFGKGAKQITATYGYGQGSLVRNRSVTGIQAGYYAADRLMIGVTGSLIKEWVGGDHLKNMLSGGPLIRYQFTSGRLSPFAALAYQIGRPTINPTVNQALFFTPGINFALLPAVRLEASYNLLFVPARERIGQPQIGATILFGTKR